VLDGFITQNSTLFFCKKLAHPKVLKKYGKPNGVEKTIIAMEPTLLYKLECFIETSTTEKNRNWYM